MYKYEKTQGLQKIILFIALIFFPDIFLYRQILWITSIIKFSWCICLCNPSTMGKLRHKVNF